MSHVFESFKRPATNDEIAAQITHDTIDEMEALRKGRESEPHTQQEKDLMERLSVLMTGPRQASVLPVIRERWPQMASLLDRKVGVVEECYDEGCPTCLCGNPGICADPMFHCRTCEGTGHPLGVIVGIDGGRYRFYTHNLVHGSQVTFLPTEDGMARNIQVIA